ncbi:response regulator [Rhizobium sp. NXC24]|uniref:response regulator n=1 Tax=Rhizobium sp. NXC24 TaxID=2048897 RepID=UPI000CDF4AFD|nr:response regulator [Rhizobium sp. NXC24]AVA25627.1 response regulator protein [Rhizobium sp. NXC24]
MKVLIVEDEAIVAHQLKTIVADAGFATLGPASTMEQALAYAPRADIALIDVALSDGRSGLQLARRLIDRYHTTIIFVTGVPEALKHGFAGAFAAIAKPFIDEDVANVLRRAGAMRMAGGHHGIG